MPGHFTDVESNDSHNVKPWFNGRVDLSRAVPRLDSAGFPWLAGDWTMLAAGASPRSCTCDTSMSSMYSHGCGLGGEQDAMKAIKEPR